MTVPFLAMQENQAAAHTANNIAAEYGVPAINMLEIQGLVDYDVDFMDAGHMNILGATKVTKYLGDWLSENSDLPDHRGDPEYSAWQEGLDRFKDFQQSMSKDNEDIYSQLIFLNLAGKKKTWALSIKGGSKCYTDDTLMKLMKSLGAGEMLDNAIASRSSYLIVSDRGKISEFAGDGEGVDIDTKAGHIYYEPASDIYRVLNLEGDSETNYLYSDEFPYVDMQLLFFKKGKVNAHQYYTLNYYDYEYAYR
jgi:hypothetical protein